jgi:hypothetical protein
MHLDSSVPSGLYQPTADLWNLMASVARRNTIERDTSEGTMSMDSMVRGPLDPTMSHRSGEKWDCRSAI